MIALLATAFVAGLAGSAHCFGMCGGMAGALGMRARMNAASAASTTVSATLYHLGRIGGYATVGAIGGALGHSAHWALSLTRYANALRIAAGVLTLLIAIRILCRWNAFAPLERLGARMWLKIQPLAKRASGNDRWYGNLAIGLLWGWLPCGLVYSIVLLTMTAASAAKGAAIMAAFGLGTLPAMLSSSLLAGTVPLLSKRTWFRHATGTAMLLFGVWMIVGTQIIHATHAVGTHVH
jgi:sulfite exporter TauE/SafE